MPLNSVKTIHTVALNDREKVYFRRVYQAGKLWLDIRLWKRPANAASYYPTRSGFKMEPHAIADLDQVLTKFKISSVIYPPEISDK